MQQSLMDKIATQNIPGYSHIRVFVCVLLALRFETLLVITKRPYPCCGGSIMNSHRKPCVSWPEGLGGGGVGRLYFAWTLISISPPSLLINRPVACMVTLSIHRCSIITVLNIFPGLLFPLCVHVRQMKR